MLRKLLKYDLKWCYKPLLVFYGLAIIISIMVRIIGSFDKSLLVLIIDKICCGALIAMIISIIINCFMRNWVRFIINIYKDESYLTHTLPVSKNQIFLSKVLTMGITLLTSFMVIVLCLAIATLNEETWMFLKEFLESSAIVFNSSVTGLVVMMVLIVFFQFLYMIMSGILGIIIGHKSNNLKIVKSILLGFAIYTFLSSLSLGITFVCGLINSDIMSLFNSVNVSSSAMKSVMIIITGLYMVYNVIIYFIGNKLLNQGVNVD